MPKTRVRLILVFVAVLISAAAWLFFRPAAAPGALVPTATFPPPPQVTITPPSLDDLAQQFPRLERLLRDPAVDSAYKDFVVAYEQGGLEAAEQLARTRGLLTADNDVRVTLVIDTLDPSRLIDDLKALGANILGVYQDLIDISIPLDVIVTTAQSDDPAAVFERIRDLEHVIGLQFSPPNLPQDAHRPPDQELPPRQNGGTILSEGLFTLDADLWHAAGFTGRGVKIGVLDQGFDGYRDLLGSELPEQLTLRSFVGGAEPDATGENHGTAVAEIIHDLAPDAELFLAYYDGGDVSMGNAVDWLLEEDVDIISHSAGGLAGPMDGTGRDAELVDRAARTAVWINSAGNSANEHLRVTFSDADADGFHDFNRASSLLAFRPAPEQATQIVLNWDDWPQAAEDYDLYLLDRDGVVLASSRNVQSGNRAPVEQILYQFQDQGAYYVAVQAMNTTRAARLDLYIHEARSMEHTTPSHSLATPADAQGALAVGAVFYRDNALEPFSSYGPTNDGRQKPEVLGPDGVSVAAFAPEGFFGTSAAAPHIAGAAALVWSAYPRFGPEDVRTFLIDATTPIENAAEADATGSGVARLPAPPPEAVAVGPTPPPNRATPVPSAASPNNPIGSTASICIVGVGVIALVAVLALRRRPAASGLRRLAVKAAPITCRTCGAQMPANTQYCSQCGRAIDVAASRACAKCGWQLRPGAAYCSNCGLAA
ncbi:MAG TPA: S8 family serine peptidase [Anaerolineae bacterium]|nr:S8 family serine peptidase [Anaerolineae bacterium]